MGKNKHDASSQPSQGKSVKKEKKVDATKEKSQEKSVGKCKKLSHEIEEIFSNAKKRKATVNKSETVNSNAGIQVKRAKVKKKDKTNEERKNFRDPPSLPRKRTAEGLVIYSAEELGVGKADAGGTTLCPFDCDCCF